MPYSSISYDSYDEIPPMSEVMKKNPRAKYIIREREAYEWYEAITIINDENELKEYIRSNIWLKDHDPVTPEYIFKYDGIIISDPSEKHDKKLNGLHLVHNTAAAGFLFPTEEMARDFILEMSNPDNFS